MSGPLKIIVLAKQVPDPESPPSSFIVDGENLRVRLEGVAPVIGTFEESALELAVRLKETEGAEVTLMSAGSSLSKAVFLKAAAVGADRMAMVEDDRLDRERLDSFTTASVLAAAVRKLGDFDLILAGRQATDTNAGQVGLMLAGMLDIPAAGPAQAMQVKSGSFVVERILSDGYETVEIARPGLVTISHEVGELRYPSLAAIKAAKSMPRDTYTLDDLDFELPATMAVEAVRLSLPSRERHCELIEAEEPEQAGAMLAERLVGDRALPWNY
jgi:electron transfer flavoprotein beta subunit